MAGSIVSVLWLCAIFIIAFGHAIYLLDRRTSSQFKTIDASVLTLLLSMFGDFEFDTFDAMDFPVLAKLFFVLFLFVGALLTMNLVRLHALRCVALPLLPRCRGRSSPTPRSPPDVCCLVDLCRSLLVSCCHRHRRRRRRRCRRCRRCCWRSCWRCCWRCLLRLPVSPHRTVLSYTHPFHALHFARAQL
jgi:hypothetical protein